MLYYALYDYLPKRMLRRASFEQLELHRMILDFKDGRRYAKIWAAKAMAAALRCMDLRDVVIICVPASTSCSHTRRYKRFSQLLSCLTGADDGFGYVSVSGKRQRRHIAGGDVGMMQHTCISTAIKGRKVLVIDDICTTCSSANEFIDGLRSAGADVRMALFLAKTKRYG